MPARVTYVESLNLALHQTMERDPSMVVLGEDILDPYGGAFRVTRGLSTRFPDRVFTTPICEASIAGLAVGLALRGMRPVAELMFGDFVTLATDQIVNHAAKFHAMYNGAVDVPLVIRTPMGGGRGYGPTHSQSLERLFLGIPHLQVVAPSHLHDAGAILRAAIEDARPVLFIENKLLYPQSLNTSGEGGDGLRISANATGSYPTVLAFNYDPRSDRPDVTVITYGGVSRLLEPIMVRLAVEEVRVLACLPTSLSPLDEPAVVTSAKASGRVVVVEEGPAAFGWGAEVAAIVYAALHRDLRCPVQRVGAAPTVIPASKPLEDRVLVSEDSIEQVILGTLKW